MAAPMASDALGSLLGKMPPKGGSDPAAAVDSSDDPDGAESAATDAIMSAFESGDRNALRKGLKSFVELCMSGGSDYSEG